MRSPVNLLAAAGLAVGGVFGMAGSLVTDARLRGAAWGIDSVGLVVATALLALKYFRAGNDCAGAGFLVFAIGEGVMLSGTANSLEGSIPAFAAGTALWAASLLLTSLSGAFATWVRVVGVTAGVLFAITSGRIFWGEQVSPLATPLPFFAYPFLVLTFTGWIWTLLVKESQACSPLRAT